MADKKQIPKTKRLFEGIVYGEHMIVELTLDREITIYRRQTDHFDNDYWVFHGSWLMPKDLSKEVGKVPFIIIDALLQELKYK